MVWPEPGAKKIKSIPMILWNTFFHMGGLDSTAAQHCESGWEEDFVTLKSI